MARANRQRDLAGAIAQAFMSAGFSSSDLLTGQITLTDLEWRCPPLRCHDLLNGYPLTDYLDYPIGADPAQLYRFWRNGLARLVISPGQVADGQGWKNTSPVARGTSQGERNLRFSVPEGYPDHDSFQGHVFTLEVAHVFMNSCPVLSEPVIDESNYWVPTLQGDVGIRDGNIIGASSEWPESIEGMVESYLENGRGNPTVECRYDLISKVRSVLNENSEMFPEFMGIDWGLQALAKLAQDKLCAPLLSSVQNILPSTFDIKRRIKIIDEAVEMMAQWMANDRIKISTLYETLVPAVYTVGAFYRDIYNMGAYIPTIMRNETLAKINEKLLAKRESILKNLGPRQREEFKREA